MIDAYPRYSELLALRGDGVSDAEIERAARRFTVDDLRDLQVWQKLAWIDPDYMTRDARVRGLVAHGRDYTEDHKQELRAIEMELLNAVVPAYRNAIESGRVEVSTSPFYHPILPLLCDSDIFKHTHPGSRMPRHRFMRPGDALAQLRQAVAYHTELFGKPPVGLWPSEGSVSDAMIPLVAQAGFRWIATDEMILANTLGTSFHRDERGLVDKAERLYRPYRVVVGDAEVACGFRDHALSDRIGFVYAGWPSDAAAEDFTARLVESGRIAETRGGEEPTIFVILDGENAWEHFEDGGRPFLRALYRRLTLHPELRMVTMAEACASPADSLEGIFPGSWIDANFYIWMGHADDQRAWSQLAEARDALDAASPDIAPDTLARARQEVLIAEGSDWCWWYGDDHSSEHDAEFDELFRRHLRNVYRLLQQPIPDELFVSNITTAEGPAAQTVPTALVSPILDGEDTSYFEWLCAGMLDVRAVGGAMHQIDRPTVVTHLRFGFDDEWLHLRVDALRSVSELLADGLTLQVTFLMPGGLRVRIAGGTDGPLVSVWQRDGDGWAMLEPAGVRLAAGSILEASLPLALFAGETPRDVAFFLTVCDTAGIELERHPPARPVRLEVPDARFAARNWTA
jgi:alpha-amylase/alpha-mannosidase (GH57 family)